MKVKYLLLGVIFLYIFVFSTLVQVKAADDDYSLGIEEDMEIILEVKTVDEDGLEDIFGDGWEETMPEDADEEGLKSKIKINEVDDDTEIDLGILGEYDAFGFEADIWEWTDEDFDEDPDEEDFEIVWFQDPEDINDAYEIVDGYSYDIVMPFVPISVVDFLDEIDEWGEGWETEDNMVIHDWIFDEENYVEIYTYDIDTGYLIEYKIGDEDGSIIYEYGIVISEEVIPGYDIPLILGITSIFIIGLIYIMKKKI